MAYSPESNRSETPEYVSHNYSAVNAHVDGLAGLIDAKLSAHRSNVFSTYAKYISALILVSGFAALLVFWGVSLLRDPKIVTVEKIVEKPVAFKPVINVAVPDGIGQLRNAAAQRIDSMSANADRHPTAFNFVIFQEIPFKSDGFREVVVGMRFKDAEAEKPERQWCYIQREDFSVFRAADHVSLAAKSGSEVATTKLTEAHAQKLNTKLEVLKKAQKLCVFR